MAEPAAWQTSGSLPSMVLLNLYHTNTHPGWAGRQFIRLTTFQRERGCANCKTCKKDPDVPNDAGPPRPAARETFAPSELEEQYKRPLVAVTRPGGAQLGEQGYEPLVAVESRAKLGRGGHHRSMIPYLGDGAVKRLRWRSMHVSRFCGLFLSE